MSSFAFEGGFLRFDLEADDLPFARFGRGRPIGDESVRLKVKRLISDAVDDVAKEVERVARANAPKKTGNLAAAIERDRPGIGGLITVQIFREAGAFPTYSVVGVNTDKAPYAGLVHEGTGLFDKRGPHLITPKTKKYMVFEKEGVTHFEKSVKGQRPQPFMQEAFDEVSASYAPARFAKLKLQLGNLT